MCIKGCIEFLEYSMGEFHTMTIEFFYLIPKRRLRKSVRGVGKEPANLLKVLDLFWDHNT
jgi:hypothetical protein